MTSQVKDELSRISVLKPCCRKAELSTLLRFAGGLHLVSGQIVVDGYVAATGQDLALLLTPTS